MFVVFSEFNFDGDIERWYYGTYDSRNEANRVAMTLNRMSDTSYGICPIEEAQAWEIQNFPS